MTFSSPQGFETWEFLRSTGRAFTECKHANTTLKPGTGTCFYTIVLKAGCSLSRRRSLQAWRALSTRFAHHSPFECSQNWKVELAATSEKTNAILACAYRVLSSWSFFGWCLRLRPRQDGRRRKLPCENCRAFQNFWGWSSKTTPGENAEHCPKTRPTKVFSSYIGNNMKQSNLFCRERKFFLLFSMFACLLP